MFFRNLNIFFPYINHFLSSIYLSPSSSLKVTPSYLSSFHSGSIVSLLALGNSRIIPELVSVLPSLYEALIFGHQSSIGLMSPGIDWETKGFHTTGRQQLSPHCVDKCLCIVIIEYVLLS